MAEVTLTVAGRAYTVACRDGEEAELSGAAELLDGQASVVAKLGGLSEARTLLMAGLLLADELMSVRRGSVSPPVPADPGLASDLEVRIAELAERADRLADRLDPITS